jgi:hypothetical protein
MKLTSVQKEFLKALYKNYKQDPTAFVNIKPYIKDMKDIKSIIVFGNEMIAKGLIDGKNLKRSRTFSAKITLKGIKAISKDIEELTIYVLEELMEEGNDLSLTEIVSFRMLENLNYHHKLYFRSLDLANHLLERGLIGFRIIKRSVGYNEIIINLTPKGKHYYEMNGGTVKKQNEKNVLKKKTCTGWKYKFEEGKYVDDPILSNYGEYDQSSNHTKQIFYKDDGSIRMQFDVEYGKDNNFGQETLYTKYHTEGNVTTQTAYNAEGSVIYKQILKFNERNSLTEKIWLTADNKVTSKEIYKYSEEGNCIKETMTGPEGKIEILYDEYGLKKESISMNTDGRVLKNYSYIIDRYGNTDEEVKYDMFGKPVYLIKFVYEYY